MAKTARPQEKHALRACDTPGCAEHGEYRAPKTREEHTDYFWFCLDCVREYNRKWDYFSGMSEDEIEEFRKTAPFGHRPTWNMHISPQDATEQMRQKLNAMFGDGFIRKPLTRNASRKTQKALETLELEESTLDISVIKAQYKKLVKRYHPDVNHNDPASTERFKQVTEAYSILLHQLEQDGPHA